MPNRSRIFALTYLMFWGVFSSLGEAAPERYTIDVWNSKTSEDLPENTIIALTQTHDGYLWLGTQNGLTRFDGVRFTVFDENNTPGLNDIQTIHLFEDGESNLWVGTKSDGVVLIKDGRAKSLGIGRGGREGRLMAACEDSEGAVWLYTADGQLCRYKDGHGIVCQLRERESKCRAMIAEKSGPVLVGTDRNLYEINPKTEFGTNSLPFERVVSLTNRLDFLLASGRGGYWRMAGGEIQKWNGNELEYNLGAYPWKNASVIPITCACEDLDGNLVVGTGGEGIWLFNAEGKAAPAHISSDQGLSHDTILSLCVDREGSLWVGTDSGGLDRIKRQVFEVVPDSLGSTVQSVCEDPRGGILFGILGGGVSQWKDGVARKFGTELGLLVGTGYIRLSDLLVRSVFADRDRQVWVGTDSPLRGAGGLFKLNDGEFSRPFGYENINDHVSAIFQDRGGRLWLGTAGGLVLEDGEQSKTFTTRDNLSSDAITSLADDPDGNLWIGTGGGGLNRLRDGQFSAFHKKDGLPSEHISALYGDRDGVLWIGTSSGLARLSKGAWTKYTKQEGLSGNSIDYLIEDTNGCLWIGSNAGLMRIPKSALNDFAGGRTNFIACRTFADPDGLPSRECTPGSQPAACQTSDGKLWFATIRGLAFVNPAELTTNTYPPPVVIESVLVDGQQQNTNGIRASLPSSITIPAGKEDLEIQFTSLNLDAPDKARFRYRMEGHEKRWIDAGNIRTVRYSSLPPGHYRFDVTACNEDGIWNQTGVSLAFIVEPPFWRQWWFLTASALILLGLIIGIVHYLSTQRLQRQLEGFRQQQALEKERSRIARDIHDQLGASLTQVSLLGEMVESDKDDPLEVEAHARQIYQTARDTSRVLDEIVWTVNPSNDTLDGLINYVCKYAQEYLAVAGLRYRLDVPSQLPAAVISPEVRHNVFLAAKEAVTNVVRHAKATEVRLRLRLEPASFILEIQDNGRGPAGLEGKSSRNGLRNMHKRMEDIGGSFALSAAPEGGALVRLTVPISNR